MLLVFSSALLLIYQIPNLIQKVRDVQHGHNNMVQSLVHLTELELTNEDLRSLLKNYTQVIQKATLPSSFLQLENKLLAAHLYYKYCQAEDHGISIEFSILNPLCQSNANEFELVDAVGILIDNALESCQAGDTIYVTVNAQRKDKNHTFGITVENPGPYADEAFLHNIFTKGYITKQPDSAQHGIGLFCGKKSGR